MHNAVKMRWAPVLVTLAMLAGCDATPPGGDRPPSPSADTPAAPADDEARIEFVEGYTRGYQHAQADGKPMLVFFTARWCDYCQQMLDEAFADHQVIRLSRQFVCILVDVDREPGVCNEFHVRGFPTIQFLSPRGVPLNRVTGKTPGEKLALQMQAALQAIALRIDRSETPSKH